MENLSKRFATAHHEEGARISSEHFKHGHRSYIPRGKQEMKRLLRRLADVREERFILKELRSEF